MAGHPLALVLHGQGHLLHHQLHAFFQRRGRLICPGLQVLPHLPEQPRGPQGAPTDHDEIAAGGFVQGLGGFGAHHIAVANDRDGNRVFHLADDLPIHRGSVHLLPGPAMNRHGISPGGFGHLGKFHGVDVAVIPALAELDGDRDAAGLLHRAYNAFGPVRLQHQGAAAAVAGNFGGGAAHVDIQPGGGILLGQLGRARHGLRFIAKKLDGTGHFQRAYFHQLGAFAAALHQPLAAHHLAHAGHGPKAHGQLPQGAVGDAGHRGQHGIGGQLPFSQNHPVFLPVWNANESSPVSL